MITDYSLFHKILCSEPLGTFQTAKISVQIELIKSK